MTVFYFPFLKESEQELEDEVDILMSSDIMAAQMSTKSITFSRAQSGWLFREDKTVNTVISYLLHCFFYLYPKTNTCIPNLDFQTVGNFLFQVNLFIHFRRGWENLRLISMQWMVWFWIPEKGILWFFNFYKVKNFQQTFILRAVSKCGLC